VQGRCRSVASIAGCHACAEDLTRRVADFEARLNQDPFVVADRLWTKDRLDPEEEKLRFSK
jgi:hypothetical protein